MSTSVTSSRSASLVRIPVAAINPISVVNVAAIGAECSRPAAASRSSICSAVKM